MTFAENVIEELRSMQDAELISKRTLSRAVRIVRSDTDTFCDSAYGVNGYRDSVMSVTDGADLAVSLATI
jgi:hypothetical protein